MTSSVKNVSWRPKLFFPAFHVAGWETITMGEASVPVTERVGLGKLAPVSISAGIGFEPQAEKLPFSRNPVGFDGIRNITSNQPIS